MDRRSLIKLVSLGMLGAVAESPPVKAASFLSTITGETNHEVSQYADEVEKFLDAIKKSGGNYCNIVPVANSVPFATYPPNLYIRLSKEISVLPAPKVGDLKQKLGL